MNDDDALIFSLFGLIETHCCCSSSSSVSSIIFFINKYNKYLHLYMKIKKNILCLRLFNKLY